MAPIAWLIGGMIIPLDWASSCQSSLALGSQGQSIPNVPEVERLLLLGAWSGKQHSQLFKLDPVEIFEDTFSVQNGRFYPAIAKRHGA